MKRWQLLLILLAMTLPPVAGGAASAQRDFVAAARSEANVVHGEQLFQGCANCHGPQGAGNSDDSVPRIAGQHPQVVIRQLVDYRHDRRLDPQMEAVAGRHQLQPADMTDLAAFIATLRPDIRAANGRGDFLQPGLAVYRSRCQSCHGRGALGNDAGLVPRLAGQHYRYLLRQFHDALEGRRPLLAASHAMYWMDLDRDALQGLADALSRMVEEP
ncbi:MAG: c-type cytochrome [Steroidobacteraceae bacterium]